MTSILSQGRRASAGCPGNLEQRLASCRGFPACAQFRFPLSTPASGCQCGGGVQIAQADHAASIGTACRNFSLLCGTEKRIWLHVSLVSLLFFHDSFLGVFQVKHLWRSYFLAKFSPPLFLLRQADQSSFRIQCTLPRKQARPPEVTSCLDCLQWGPGGIWAFL